MFRGEQKFTGAARAATAWGLPLFAAPARGGSRRSDIQSPRPRFPNTHPPVWPCLAAVGAPNAGRRTLFASMPHAFGVARCGGRLPVSRSRDLIRSELPENLCGFST